MEDIYNLQRFVSAQAEIFDRVLDELTDGKKESHWMWFIFPQITGLGHSPTALFYAIKSLEEAHAYYQHELLGKRLEQCTSIVNKLPDIPVETIFGYPDYLKFRSSMTLFNLLEETEIFQQALEKYFDGNEDELTLDLLD